MFLFMANQQRSVEGREPSWEGHGLSSAVEEEGLEALQKL